MQFETLNYRHAEEILSGRTAIFSELKQIFENAKVAHIDSRENALTTHLFAGFINYGWDREAVMDHQPRSQRFDLLKDRTAVEVEFSDQEFFYRDYIRFLAAHDANKIDVGVLVTRSDCGLSRIKADLAWLRPIMTVPLWVVALKCVETDTAEESAPLAEKSQSDPIIERGWILDVLTVVRLLNKAEFSNDDIYEWTPHFERLHPDNHHIHAKIRQKLQNLRDVGLLAHVEPGRWRIK